MKKLITKQRFFSLAVIAAIIIIPFLYSYFYLGAFWDPYSKLDSMPVAVVNNDQGAVIDGADRNLGQDLCERLKKDGSLKFIFTDAESAKAGTEGSDYYATITIPEDFSRDIASANTDDKQSATIIFSPNEKRNYLASQILSRAVIQMEEETRASVNKEIVQKLADTIQEMPDQLTELQDGLGKLSEGSSDLLDGISTLSDGTNTLYDGTTTLAEGTSTLAEGTSTLLKGTKTLADGTGTLLEGTDTLLEGTNTLAEGTTTFYNKFSEYKDGVSSLSVGSTALATGAQSIKAGVDQLQAGSELLVEKTNSIGQLTTGAQTIATGTKAFDTSLNQYTTGVNSLISTVDSTSTFLTQYVKANPSLMKEPAFAAFITKLSEPTNAQSIQLLMEAGPKLTAASAQLVAGSEQLSQGTANLPDLNAALVSLSAGITKVQAGSSDLTTGAQTLKEGIATLSSATDQLYTASGNIADGAARLNSGASDLNSGAKDINEGAERIYSGVQNLDSGMQDLNTGAQDLNSGASDLNDGAGELCSGAEELSDGIDTAKDGVDTAITDANEQMGKLNGIAEFAAEPVLIEQENVTTITNYGTAFAPYFMSLSLWVGALILFVGIYLDTEGKFKILSRESNHKLARSFMFLLIGFAQAMALALVVKLGLGLRVQNVALYYTSVCLVSMVFIAIVQFLIVHLKSVGKLLSIVLLILQLTSCGGTFPMETVPKMFNVMFPFMPMTYSVALFKQAITDTDTNAVLYNGGVLVAILVVFMALTIMLSTIKFKKSVKSDVQMPVLFE